MISKEKKRSSPKLRRIFQPKSKIQTVLQAEARQILHNFGSQIPLGELFLFLGQKSTSKALKTCDFAYFSGQWGLEPPPPPPPPLATHLFTNHFSKIWFPYPFPQNCIFLMQRNKVKHCEFFICLPACKKKTEILPFIATVLIAYLRSKFNPLLLNGRASEAHTRYKQ